MSAGMAMDTDNLLSLIRSSLATARREAPNSPAVKRAADAFDNLDRELQQGAMLPEDWCGDDDADDDDADDDAGDDAGDVDPAEDTMTDEELEAEMRRVSGGDA